MNIPNLITIGRLCLIPIYFLVFFSDLPYKTELSLFVIFLSGISDVLDGYLARKYKWVTFTGMMLDPLADKLMMISVILSFVLSDMISWWAASLFIIRDVGMIISSIFFHVTGKKMIPANIFGKMTTLLFYLAFLLIMYRVPHAEAFLWCVIILAFITSAIYYAKFRKVNQMAS